MVDIAHRSPNSSPGIAIGPVTDRAKGDYVQPNVMGEDAPAEQRAFSSAKAMQQFEASLPASTGELGSMRPFLTSLAAGRPMGVDMDVGKVRGELAKSAEIANAYSAEWREHARWYQTTSPDAGGGRRNGIDPRELARPGRPPKDDRKARQLCRQVAETLSQVLGGECPLALVPGEHGQAPLQGVMGAQ